MQEAWLTWAVVYSDWAVGNKQYVHDRHQEHHYWQFSTCAYAHIHVHACNSDLFLPLLTVWAIVCYIPLMNSVDTPSFFRLPRRYIPSSSLPWRASKPVGTVERERERERLYDYPHDFVSCVCVCVHVCVCRECNVLPPPRAAHERWLRVTPPISFVSKVLKGL